MPLPKRFTAARMPQKKNIASDQMPDVGNAV